MSESLKQNMQYLCDEARMLTGITVAYGTPAQSEWMQYGRAQETALTNEGFTSHIRPLVENTIYDLASLTKLFATVMTLILVQHGKLSLDEFVGRIDPRFVHLRDVTVFDVLSFRASLQTPQRIDATPDREEGLHRLFAVAVGPTPAIRLYSDINAMVIKYVVEARCGMAFADALKTFVFAPVGMTQTFCTVPQSMTADCMCYNYEHRIAGEQYVLRTDTPLGTPHDPKASLLSQGGRDLCGHAGLFSTRKDMVHFAQALLSGELLSHEYLCEIGQNRTGRDNGDGTHRQYLGYLCFAKHPVQRLSEVPAWMGQRALGMSGFTGNHLSIDPDLERFVLFLGNRCHGRVSHITPPEGKTLSDYGLNEQGVGLILWKDGRMVPSSARYVYFKDACLHAPIKQRMRALGWL